MNKIGFISLGCPKNLVDSEVMMGQLKQNGYEITADAAEADTVVVNTCGFIESAKKESIEAILEAARLKTGGKATRLIVAGCLVERYRDELKAEMPEVDAFIATWSVFMLTAPFPAIESDCEVKEADGKYQFSHKEGATDVLTVTDKDFMIVEIKVSGSGFNASLKPVLENTAKGFILKGYSANYQTGARNTAVKVRLDYQEVSGLQLPSKVKVDTVYEGKPAQVEWLFTGYQVKVR